MRRCCCGASFDSVRVQCVLSVVVAAAIACVEYPLGNAGCREKTAVAGAQHSAVATRGESFFFFYKFDD